jgi:hypothetical protein
MPVLQGFIGGAYVARSLNFDAQRCVNLYLEKSESGTSKDAAMLVGTPGLTTWVNPAGRVVRGLIAFNPTQAFAVVGQNVYQIDTSGVVTITGTIQNGTTPVSMASNGTVIFMVTGDKGYVITPATNTMIEYIDPSFTGADRVDFINGAFVFNQPNTGKFWAMDPYSTTLDPLSFATAEGSPDALISLIVDHNEIWLFGSTTTEVWYNNGNTATFPYSRIDGAFLEQGCAAKHSVAKMGSSVYWLSANERGQGMIFRARGYTPERISTHAIEKSIAEYGTIDDAVAYCYQQEGHDFYVLNFPSADRTWVFDASCELWHERAWRRPDGQLGRHRSNCHMFFARKNIVGDWQNGNIYDMDLDTYSDDGNPIIRLRASNHVTMEMMRVAHNSIMFDMQTGVGIVPVSQGNNPKAMLRWSDDGGHAWSSQRECPIGNIGQFKTRARFTRLGQARDRVYELSISDPVKVCILAAVINGQ